MPDETAPENDAAHANIGIVCALAIELGAFLERCERVKKYKGGDFVFRGGRYDDVRIAVVETGLGFARARRATQAMLDAHTPQWVVSAGFSGALLPEMKVGQIVMANSIVDTHGHELKVDMKMPADPEHGLHVGRLVNTDEIVQTIAEKKRLAEETGAIAVDMESLAVAQICQERGIRFLAVRVISDDLSADLPDEVRTVIGTSGSARLGAALGAVWKRPGSVKEMWHLRETAMKAAERLASFLDGVVKQLHAADH
ncbi:MAG: 5'-methylthioadenosine nucleosidase [Planctomycetaceae bacterium]|jgi:adenosylhomocysteine nucleosidase|nr:5'-methylthioadenosine nucleosidase [Planctomycetaceae bacterium]MBT6157819.1 5'-methylthioadenosine nucleosidase [Planctomycetaceae bacterium]MBT6487111.1 5'-methylthioadenosine nucleosidase [Planctomycetaceae bacterium]MBT6496943.1 5'-methylthioadenosine nucleosidase [Planctomycetaceae bacterium]